jgi:hypothetical protein
MVIFHSYVSLPEGTSYFRPNFSIQDLGLIHDLGFLHDMTYSNSLLDQPWEAPFVNQAYRVLSLREMGIGFRLDGRLGSEPPSHK